MNERSLNKQLQALKVPESQLEEAYKDAVEEDGGSKRKLHHKSDKTQKKMRVQHVLNWLVDGMASADAIEKIMKKWDVCERTGWRYIAEAREALEAAAQQHVKGSAIAQLYRLEELYSRCIDSGDFKAALEIIKTQNRMLGLNAPDRVETASVEQFESMSMAEKFSYFHKKAEEAASRKAGVEGREDLN